MSVVGGAEAVASTNGLIIDERGSFDGQAVVVDNRAAATDRGEGADAAVARLGQVCPECAALHAKRPETADPAPQGVTRERWKQQRGTIGVVGSQRLVVGNRAVGDMERAKILDSAAERAAKAVEDCRGGDDYVRVADRLVAVDDNLVESQVAQIQDA